ncbi:MAG: hypothetical protein APF80_03775 [Alphaproteobacteria bacterium BRH_c36]|nr:MAG: hypothetical protein APF80_03775 [Alphaproteobacteria bacterium BRH_c36]
MGLLIILNYPVLFSFYGLLFFLIYEMRFKKRGRASRRELRRQRGVVIHPRQIGVVRQWVAETN